MKLCQKKGLEKEKRFVIKRHRGYLQQETIVDFSNDYIELCNIFSTS